MSYYANGQGYVVRKNDAPQEEVEEILNGVFDNSIAFFDDDMDSDISFDGNYDETTIYKTLRKAEPYLRNYRIDFKGEDGEHWTIGKSEDDPDEDYGMPIYHYASIRKLVDAGYPQEEAEKIVKIIGL